MWADNYIEQLNKGETVQFRPRGNSMEPRIKSGQLVTVSPTVGSWSTVDAKVGDIVLCKVNGHQYVHLVKSIGSDGRCQIGNNHGKINGWASAVYGIVTAVED